MSPTAHPTPDPTPDPTSDPTPDPTPDRRPERTSTTVDRGMLEDFLNQHLLGSRSGVKAIRAAAQTWADTPQEPDLQRLGDEVAEEQEYLEALIRELGLSTSLPEKAMGLAAEAAGRVNPVNALRTRGSGWTQVELDLLQGMFQAKSSMWHVLEELAPHVPQIDAAQMRRLHDQAQEQQRLVQRIGEQTLAERFLR